MKRTRVAWAILLALLLAPVAFAQTTGRIEGRVTDNDGAPLPGASVTATSAALQGMRVVTSDESGAFRLLALPPGEYSLKAELDGFNVVEAPSIAVGLDKTVSLEMQLTPAFGEAVTVTTEAPAIDLRTTTGGANFNAELISDLPTARTFNGLAFNAPGVVTAGNPNGGAMEPSIGGASAAENRYVVDGLDTTDPAMGTIGSMLAFEFIDEVQVKTGGYEAEYGGALGGVLNVITKSGGNELTGDVFGYFNDDSLQSESPPTATTGQDLGFTEYDFGVDLGGKILADKLWYFVAANPSTSERDITTRADIASMTVKTESRYYAGKLTWQISPSHQLVASVFGDPTDTENGSASRNSAGVYAHDLESGADSYGATYNGTVGANFLLEASYGRYDQADTQTANEDTAFYQLRSPSQNHWLFDFGCATPDQITGSTGNLVFNPDCRGGTFVQETGDRSREELRGALSYFGSTGPLDHELKLGANMRQVDYIDHAHYPGPASGPARDSTGFVYDPGGLVGQRWELFSDFARIREYDQNSFGETEETALFLQDRLRLGDHLTVTLGVRSDAFEATGERSNEFTDRALDFGFSDMVAPRVGFTWDVTKNGRSKLYGHFGRFYESVPLDINVRAFGREQFNFYYFYYPEDGSLPTAANPGVWFYTYQLGLGTGVDPGVKPMYSEELVGGFEYELAPNWSVGLKYVDRELGDVIEDISVDGGQTYFITNPGGTYTVNPVTGEPLDETVVFPEAERNYTAYELTLNKRFSDNWQLFASYVNSENIGNYGGLFRQDNGQLDPNITSLFDLPDLLLGAYGLLPNDREHQFKVYGSYLWPFQLVTGFSGQFLSGTPISKLGSHPIYGTNERFVTPRGSAGRTDDLWNIDLHLEYPIRFSGDLELKLIADVFNVTDEDAATAVDQTWTFASARETTDPNECGGPGTGTPDNCPLGNANWGNPTAYQAPQTIRLGAKLSW